MAIKIIKCEWRCYMSGDMADKVDGSKYACCKKTNMPHLSSQMVLQERQCQRWRPLQVGALLKSVYTDLSNPASFSSPNGLYKAAKKINPNITFRDVEFWLETQLVYTLYQKKQEHF